ncbi:MAG: 4'-phosphopantetheinyl transferase superfamily protein [bacterium]|nr:4'-phosphopantetheinyl transferase superfamily protein [bacterium]
MIDVSIAENRATIPPQAWEAFISCWPEHERERIMRYRHERDRQARFLSRWLLWKALGAGAIPEIQYAESGKPFLNGGPEINWSHSGAWVTLALCANGSVGIDVEAMRPIEMDDFRRYMRDEVWERIQAADDRRREFFRWWTTVESAIKADGRGMSAPWTTAKAEERGVWLDDVYWHTQEISIDGEHLCYLSHSKPDRDIRIARHDFSSE